MKSFQDYVQLGTAGGLRVTDITEKVAAAVRESGVRDGICSVYSPHTTCWVRVNEWELGFLEDFAMMLKRIVRPEDSYAYDEWGRRTEDISREDQRNGNEAGTGAHGVSVLIGPAGESIPVRAGNLCLGTWQRVLFLELDSERGRRWLVHVIGV